MKVVACKAKHLHRAMQASNLVSLDRLTILCKADGLEAVVGVKFKV